MSAGQLGALVPEPLSRPAPWGAPPPALPNAAAVHRPARRRSADKVELATAMMEGGEEEAGVTYADKLGALMRASGAPLYQVTIEYRDLRVVRLLRPLPGCLLVRWLAGRLGGRGAARDSVRE